MRQWSCEQHVQYRAGCADCQARARFSEGRRLLLASRGVRYSHGVALTASRLQELRAAGYSVPYLANATDLGVATLNRICNGRVDWVQLHVFRAVERVYGELRAFPGPSPQVAGKARKRGWTPPPVPATPEPVDEDHVDVVAVERVVAGDDSVCLTRAEKVAAWDLLGEQGMSAAERIRFLRVGELSIARWRGGFTRKKRTA